MNILAVGAHAADIEFSVGAVLLKHATEGHKVTIVHLTLGEKGNPTVSPTEYALQKRQEAEMAAQYLQCNVVFLDKPDAYLAYDDIIATRLAQLIQQHRPEVIVTHWSGSFHQDHRNCNNLVKRAMFLAELPTGAEERRPWKVNRLYYTDNWEDQEGYVPDVAIDVSDVFDRWLDAAEQYTLFREGGLLGFDYRSYYQSLAGVRGSVARVKQAVALKTERDPERLPIVPVL